MSHLVRTLICAWVLWAHHGVIRESGVILSPAWMPMGAYTSGETACETALRAWARPQGWDLVVCLPDTVDPRGPRR